MERGIQPGGMIVQNHATDSFVFRTCSGIRPAHVGGYTFVDMAMHVFYSTPIIRAQRMAVSMLILARKHGLS